MAMGGTSQLSREPLNFPQADCSFLKMTDVQFKLTETWGLVVQA